MDDTGRCGRVRLLCWQSQACIWRGPPPQCQCRALTQDVGGHAQQRVEHVMDLPVPLDHICQFLVIHESGGCTGVWRDPLKTIHQLNLYLLISLSSIPPNSKSLLISSLSVTPNQKQINKV